MSYNKTLLSQAQKNLPVNYLEDPILKNFLEVIEKTYATYEKDKRITEHAFEISEREYQQANQDLQYQIELKRASIQKLKQAIKSLDTNATFFVTESDDNDLMSTIAYLEEQIVKTKVLEAELLKAIEFAEKALKAKSEFLSVMSHEIRTPLNAIIGTILLLKYKELTPDQEELVRVMEISSENLLSLINDVLDFNKLEEGKIVFAEHDIDIFHFLKNIKMAHRIRAEEKQNIIKIMFDDDIPDYIVGDEVRLGQILNNLISNAIKFTKEGTISIQVSLKSQNKDWVTLEFAVKDTGIGIPFEKQQAIFESFTQANANITREYGGSGLGLTIIKKLLELQGSGIHVESTPGKGSRFFFDLTFKRSSASGLKKEEAIQNIDEKNLQGVKVLLVEDVVFNVMVAERLLKKWNAEVDVANNGQIAVEKAREGNYDVILMDIHMPVMDGYTATAEIRKFNTTTPIVALTASSSIHDQANIVGMNGFVSKPFNMNDLYSVIYKHVSDR
jgi:signal transduction histidine kinase/CheY-like chemotaxis protein